MAAEACVVGVDFGTLSGRAVVVRAPTGRSSDRPCTSSRTGRWIARSPPPARRSRPVGAAGPRRLGRGPAHGRARRRCAAAGVDPGDVHRDRHRLHRLHAAAGAARRHAAVPARGPRRPPARVAEAVEAPRRAAPGRPHQRARRGARRAVAGALRRQDLLRVGVRQGAAGARGGPRGLRAHGALGRGRRLDHLAACGRRDAQRLHRRLQGASARTARYPSARLPARARPAASPTSSRTSSRAR